MSTTENLSPDLLERVLMKLGLVRSSGTDSRRAADALRGVVPEGAF